MKTATAPLPPLRSVKVLDQLRERIRYLHYSLRTEQAYVNSRITRNILTLIALRIHHPELTLFRALSCHTAKGFAPLILLKHLSGLLSHERIHI